MMIKSYLKDVWSHFKKGLLTIVIIFLTLSGALAWDTFTQGNEELEIIELRQRFNGTLVMDNNGELPCNSERCFFSYVETPNIKISVEQQDIILCVNETSNEYECIGRAIERLNSLQYVDEIISDNRTELERFSNAIKRVIVFGQGNMSVEPIIEGELG